jgi:DNA replication protein DnaC
MKSLSAITAKLKLAPPAKPLDVPPTILQPGLCTADCPVCGGQGWVRANLPVGHPQFGRLTICPNGDLLRLPDAERYGIILDEARRLTWGSVLERGAAMKAVQAVQDALQAGYGWVYLWGDFGQGKTLILKIAVAEALRQRRFASYIRMTEMVENLRSAFDAQNPSAEAERRLEWWTDLPVLAVDEIDRLRQTAYASEQQFLLLDRRYEQALRQRSVTLLAANAAPEQLPGYLADRILDGRFAIVRLNGDSGRLGMDWDTLD